MDFEKNYDVAVIGGGIAGIAAALASARRNKKTVLIEKTVLPGGLATSGLVYIYLPLCDGNGTQVTFGICEELIRLSLKYGPGDIPENWSKQCNGEEARRFRCIFSPAAFILALDEVLEEAGVDIWFDTLACAVQVNSENKLQSIEVENESGRGRISADCFIDASGSGSIARRAGVPCSDEINYLTMWALEHNQWKHSPYSLCENIEMFTWMDRDIQYRGISGHKVSEFTLESRKVLRKRYEAQHSSGKVDRNQLFPLTVPAMPQFRKLFAVNGHKTLSDGLYGTYFEDSIGLTADWRKPGYVWEVPYGTLVPQKVKGLLTAGRCISSVGDAWEVTRVIPAAALTGEAAGTAAALSVELGTTPDLLDVKILQETLKGTGFPLHLQDVGL